MSEKKIGIHGFWDRVTLGDPLCASCGKPLPADEPAYLAADGTRAHISENPDHRLVSWQKIRDPIYGIPRWRSDERGVPTGEADPTPSPSASCTCSCGLMIVAPTNSGAAHAFRKHAISSVPKGTDTQSTGRAE